MNDDDPADVVHERFAELVLGVHPLGRPIGGTPATIQAVGRGDIAAHYREHYIAPGLVVTAAGGIDHDALCAAVTEQLAGSDWRAARRGSPAPAPGRAAGRHRTPSVPAGCSSYAGRPSRPTWSSAPSG